jgi:hypothetical protein
VVVLLGACRANAAAQGNDPGRSPEATLAAFADALRRCEEAYSTISAEGALTSESNRGKADAATRVTRYVFRIKPDHEKYEMTFDQAEAKGKLYRRVACMNPRYSFMLDQPMEDAPYQLADFTEGVNLNISGAVETNTRFLKYTYDYIGTPTSALLEDPSFALKRIAEEVKDGKKLVRIEFSVKPDRETNYLQSASILASPDESWAIYEFAATLGGVFEGITNVLTIQYGGVKDGVPIPKIIEDRRDENVVYRFQFDRLRLEAPGDDEFLLSHYGLDEPPPRAEARPRDLLAQYRLPLIAGFAALVALIVWVGSRRKPLRGSRIARS